MKRVTNRMWRPCDVILHHATPHSVKCASCVNCARSYINRPMFACFWLVVTTREKRATCARAVVYGLIFLFFFCYFICAKRPLDGRDCVAYVFLKYVSINMLKPVLAFHTVTQVRSWSALLCQVTRVFPGFLPSGFPLSKNQRTALAWSYSKNQRKKW